MGTAGRFAHVLLQAAAHCSASAPQAPLALARIAFLWREHLHPLAQRLLPIMDREVFRSPAAGPLHSAVAGHVVRGQVLFPGAGYLVMGNAGSA